MSLRYGTILLLAAVWTAPLRGQESTGTVTGRVTDQVSQQPIRGANVTLAGKAAQSRDDGRYVLTGVPAGTDTLRVTLIGFAPAGPRGDGLDRPGARARPADERPGGEPGRDGGGRLRRAAAGNITGAVTRSPPRSSTRAASSARTELIQNKVAGVQVVDNNEPGGGISIRIRGATSVNASSEPLYVIDGVPIGTGAGGGLSAGRNPLNFLNPDDIESITVLRDASAAAIYGANAANGVVLITTKNGHATGPQFEYSGSVSASSDHPAARHAERGRSSGPRSSSTRRRTCAQLGIANTDWFDQIDRTGDRPGAQRRPCRARARTGLPAVGQLPGPGRHHPGHQRPAGLVGGQLQSAAVQRPAEPALQRSGLADRGPFTPGRRAVQRGPDGSDPAGPQIGNAPPASTTGRATLLHVAGQSGGASSPWPPTGARPIAASATCRASTACRSSRGSRPTSTWATT